MWLNIKRNGLMIEFYHVYIIDGWIVCCVIHKPSCGYRATVYNDKLVRADDINVWRYFGNFIEEEDFEIIKLKCLIKAKQYNWPIEKIE